MRPRRRPPSLARRATGLGQCGTQPVASMERAVKFDFRTQDHPHPCDQRRGEILRAPDAGQLQDEIRRQNAHLRAREGDAERRPGRILRGDRIPVGSGCDRLLERSRRLCGGPGAAGRSRDGCGRSQGVRYRGRSSPGTEARPGFLVLAQCRIWRRVDSVELHAIDATRSIHTGSTTSTPSKTRRNSWPTRARRWR